VWAQAFPLETRHEARADGRKGDAGQNPRGGESGGLSAGRIAAIGGVAEDTVACGGIFLADAHGTVSRNAVTVRVGLTLP